jgi:ribonuclease HII
MPLEELMISPIDSRHSPVSVQIPQNFPEVQDSASVSTKKAGRIRTGVAECSDSYEQPAINKAKELDEKRRTELRLEIHEKDKSIYWEKVIVEKQKIEQAKAYRPDQQGVQLHPSVTPVVNVSLAADLSANMLSMIRV